MFNEKKNMGFKSYQKNFLAVQLHYCGLIEYLG